jgi:hypothetical protein
VPGPGPDSGEPAACGPSQPLTSRSHYQSEPAVGGSPWHGIARNSKTRRAREFNRMVDARRHRLGCRVTVTQATTLPGQVTVTVRLGVTRRDIKLKAAAATAVARAGYLPVNRAATEFSDRDRGS